MRSSLGFLSLPGEIRNQIYDYLLDPIPGDHRVRRFLIDNYKMFHGLIRAPGHYVLNVAGPRPKAYNYETAIMATNRQIHQESSSVFRAGNQFILFETNSLALSRVFFEADIMMIERPMIRSAKPCASLSLLWMHPFGGRLRFHYMIPSEELYFLASVLFKANLCEQGFFNEAHLQAHLSHGLSCAIQDKIGFLMLLPFKQLYNVKNRIIGPGLRIHASYLLNIPLCPLFDLGGLLDFARNRLHLSIKIFGMHELEAAWQCCRSAIDDLEGGVRTNYSKLSEDQLRLFTAYDELQALMMYWLLRYQLALRIWVQTLYTASRDITLRRRFPSSEYRDVIMIRLLRLRAATFINMGENTDVALDDLEEAMKFATKDPKVFRVLQGDLEYAKECHEEILQRQPITERTPEMNAFFGYGTVR